MPPDDGRNRASVVLESSASCDAPDPASCRCSTSVQFIRLKRRLGWSFCDTQLKGPAAIPTLSEPDRAAGGLSRLKTECERDSVIGGESRGGRTMMGWRNQDQGQLFYEFRLDEAVPEDHLVRQIRALLESDLGLCGTLALLLPVIDKSKREDGIFSREDFRYDDPMDTLCLPRREDPDDKRHPRERRNYASLSRQHERLRPVSPESPTVCAYRKSVIVSPSITEACPVRSAAGATAANAKSAHRKVGTRIMCRGATAASGCVACRRRRAPADAGARHHRPPIKRVLK